MKVILVNGSPNENGCTRAALTLVANELDKEGIDTEIFWLGNKPISGCIACGCCSELGKCALGGIVNEFAEKAKTADGFVFGSPVHYASASGSITSFMDRLFFSSGEALAFKPAAAIVSARRAGTTAALDQLNKYFCINQMPVVSSRYWNMVHGLEAEDVAKDEEGVQIMKTLGKNMAYLLKCIQAGKEKGITPPEQEEPAFTNFIR